MFTVEIILILNVKQLYEFFTNIGHLSTLRENDYL